MFLAKLITSMLTVNFCLQIDVKEAPKEIETHPQWEISEDEEDQDQDDDSAVSDSDLVESDNDDDDSDEAEDDEEEK